jgi:hypothetical protein
LFLLSWFGSLGARRCLTSGEEQAEPQKRKHLQVLRPTAVRRCIQGARRCFAFTHTIDLNLRPGESLPLVYARYRRTERHPLCHDIASLLMRS